MKRILLGLLGSTVLAATAMAADLPVRGPAPEPIFVAPVFSWTGAYVGLQAGYGFNGKSRFDDGAVSNPFKMEGFVGGGTVGYNWQFHPNFVVGVEADASFSDVKGAFGPGDLGQPGGAGWGCGSGPCRTKVDWFGTARVRLGPSFGNFLVYATGGWAFGNFKSQIDNTTTWHTGNFANGWTAGGGVEYALNNSWSAKIEYLHVNLGWSDRTQPNFFRSDAKFDVVRAGLNYRFGWGAPAAVVAKY